MKQTPAPEIFSLLTQWAFRPDASTDLRNIFGGDSDRYQPLLQSIRSGDFSWLPQVQFLSASSMAMAYGAYSRETGTIYLSADCPQDLITAVLLEEIGHHIDALFNQQETPGDEGSLFSAAVRGITLTDGEMASILNEDDATVLNIHGREITVECASRVPTPTSPRIPTTSATRQPVAPVVTVKPGAKGTITKNGDWVTSDVDYTLDGGTVDATTKRGLSLVGGGNLIGTGNAGGTSKQNTLTAASNTGNTTLIAGTASTTMRGGSGDNWLDATRSQGTVSIQGGTGNSTMYAANGPATLVGGDKNNFLVAGTATTRTLGQSLLGGKSTNSLFGNTLFGGTGRDTLRSGAGFSTLISGSNPGVSTTIGAIATLGVTSIRVASAAGLAVGQQITGNGIASGTTITAIAGTQLTLSAKTTASLSAGTQINTVGNILIGQGLSNSLVANVGNDSLAAVSGNSTLLGGVGRTTLQGGALGSNNWLQSGYTLAAGTGGNTLIGGAGSNTLVAGATGSDSIVGGANQNLLLVTEANRSSISNDRISLSTQASAKNTLGVSLSSGTSLGDAFFSGMVVQGVSNL
ncbi:MAG: calcium-binding protein, partial [Verrucomicrobia bacterium]|nr:calcium-binding protein [Verrucomicrobiota bacterium]